MFKLADTYRLMPFIQQGAWWPILDAHGNEVGGVSFPSPRSQCPDFARAFRAKAETVLHLLNQR